MSARPSSGLPPIHVVAPTLLQTQPAGLVPTTTPLPGPVPTTVSAVMVPNAEQMSAAMVQATTGATE
jgi:hypothetical protein